MSTTKKATAKKANVIAKGTAVKATKKATAKKATTAKVVEAKPAKAPAKVTVRESKVDPKRLAAIERILENLMEEGEEGGKIHCILTLHIKGFSNMEIVEAGFNKSTVYRQVGEYKKLKKAPAVEYQGFPIYEARVRRVMQSKGLTREKAISYIDKMDIKALEEKSDN